VSLPRPSSEAVPGETSAWLSQHTLVRKSGVSWSQGLFANRPSNVWLDGANATSSSPFLARSVPSCVGVRFTAGSVFGVRFVAAALLSDGSRLKPAYYALATMVAASRIHVRIHHGSDVLGGIVVGVGLGALAKRVWRIAAS